MILGKTKPLLVPNMKSILFASSSESFQWMWKYFYTYVQRFPPIKNGPTWSDKKKWRTMVVSTKFCRCHQKLWWCPQNYFVGPTKTLSEPTWLIYWLHQKMVDIIGVHQILSIPSKIMVVPPKLFCRSQHSQYTGSTKIFWSTKKYMSEQIKPIYWLHCIMLNHMNFIRTQQTDLHQCSAKMNQ